MKNFKKKNKINKITIGLPCYNEEKNIEKSIKDSLNFIKNNKISNYEKLIIDNNSTDNTLKKIEKFKKNKNIKIIKNDKNIFYSGSVGKIIYLSKYKEIGIIDIRKELFCEISFLTFDVKHLFFSWAVIPQWVTTSLK